MEPNVGANARVALNDKEIGEISEDEIKRLIEQRIVWVGFKSERGNERKIPIKFDELFRATMAGAIPNISKRFKNVKSIMDCVNVIYNYLSEANISSSHFPTILQKNEAPNYHYEDYPLTSKT